MQKGSEAHAMSGLRSRLMAYSRGMPEAKHLRQRFAHIMSLAELEELAAENISHAQAAEPAMLVA